MQSVTSATAVATTVRANLITLFASLELSKSKWVVTINSPGSEKFSKHVVAGGDGACPARPSFAVEGEGRAALRACRSKRSSFRKRDWTGFRFSLALATRSRPRGRRGFDAVDRRHRRARQSGSTSRRCCGR